MTRKFLGFFVIGVLLSWAFILIALGQDGAFGVGLCANAVTLWVHMEGGLVWRYRSLRSLVGAWAFRRAIRRVKARWYWVYRRDVVSYIQVRERTIGLVASYEDWEDAAIVGFHELGHLSHPLPAGNLAPAKMARVVYRNEVRAWRWAFAEMPPALIPRARQIRRMALGTYRAVVVQHGRRRRRSVRECLPL